MGRRKCDTHFSLGEPICGYAALTEILGQAARILRTEMLSKHSTILEHSVILRGKFGILRLEGIIDFIHLL